MRIRVEDSAFNAQWGLWAGGLGFGVLALEYRGCVTVIQGG